ncbi:MAG: hypothetical protein LBT33_04695 [Spirochaetia bacterium]|nr:hypothetical protein [Spirochaetia bacterium]
MTGKFLLLVFVFLFPLCSLAAQSEAPASPPVDTTPEPYAPDEFPYGIRALRRAEIITLGLFPFAYFFSSFAYDTGRYAMHGFNSSYAPGPFASAERVSRSESDTRNVILISISLSALLAAVDFFIELDEPEKTR